MTDPFTDDFDTSMLTGGDGKPVSQQGGSSLPPEALPYLPLLLAAPLLVSPLGIIVTSAGIGAIGASKAREAAPAFRAWLDERGQDAKAVAFWAAVLGAVVGAVVITNTGLNIAGKVKALSK